MDGYNLIKKDLENAVTYGKYGGYNRPPIPKFFSRLPMTHLSLPANVLSEDGNDIFNCVEASSRKEEIILRIIIEDNQVKRGINLHLSFYSKEQEAKYRYLRFLIRNVGNIKITFPAFRVTYSGYKDDLSFYIRDFDIVE